MIILNLTLTELLITPPLFFVDPYLTPDIVCYFSHAHAFPVHRRAIYHR